MHCDGILRGFLSGLLTKNNFVLENKISLLSIVQNIDDLLFSGANKTIFIFIFNLNFFIFSKQSVF